MTVDDAANFTALGPQECWHIDCSGVTAALKMHDQRSGIGGFPDASICIYSPRQNVPLKHDQEPLWAGRRKEWLNRKVLKNKVFRG